MLISWRVHLIVALMGSMALCVCAQVSTSLAQPKVAQGVARIVARQGGGHRGGGSISNPSRTDPTSSTSSIIPSSTSTTTKYHRSSDSVQSSSDPTTSSESTPTSQSSAPTTAQPPTTSDAVVSPSSTQSASSSNSDTTSSTPTPVPSSSSPPSSSRNHSVPSSSSLPHSSVSASSASVTSSNASMTATSMPSASASLANDNSVTSNSSSTNTGAIVGGVVGGLAGLVVLGGLVWFWKVRRRKQAEKDMPYYADDMVESDFANHDKSSPVQQPTPMRSFVPPAIMDEELHSDQGAYYDHPYAGQYMHPQGGAAGYDDYSHGYGSNTETSSTTAPHSEYIANLMTQRARANPDYTYIDEADLGGEGEHVFYSPISNEGHKPDTQDEIHYGKPDTHD